MPAATSKFQSPNGSTLDDNFQKDWSAAQDNYQSAINSGFKAEDAQKLYLQPVQDKWDIVTHSPGLQSDKKRFAEFSKDFDTAQDNYKANYNSYSRDGGQWAATQPGSIAPTLDKWSIASKLPVPAEADSMLAEKEGALSEARSGFDAQDILRGHPQAIFSDQKFLSRFQTALGEGWKARQSESKAEKKAAMPPDVLKLADRRAQFQKLESQDPLMPESLKGLLDKEVGNLDQQLTNPPPATAASPAMDLSNPPVRFQPSAGAQPQPQGSEQVIPKAAIDLLKSKPELANFFDQKYGTGMAEHILGQQQ